MIRINLIPPEILQSRKDERRWKWVWLAGGIAALAVAVFSQAEEQLGARQDAVDAAIKGRIDWSEMLYELGLVLPSDVYLTTFTGVDNAGSGSVVTMAGQAVYDPDDVPANGYKSIAKMLVRLTELKELNSVWLTSATLGTGTDTAAPMYQWAVNASITPQ